MNRKLHISFDKPGLRGIEVLVDDSSICKLRPHQTFDADISEKEHEIRVNLGGFPIFKGAVAAGDNDWTFSYEKEFGSFTLYENKPFYGKKL